MNTILVVDDMAIFRDPLAASLRLAGYDTAAAADGKEALARVAAKRPDLIVFYDGFNDMIGTFEQAIVHKPDFSQPVVYDPSALAGLRSDKATFAARLDALGGPAHLARQSADRYDRLVSLIRRQLGGLGIEVAFFYQPDFTAAPVQRRSIVRSYPELSTIVGPLTTYLAEAARRQPSYVHDLHEVFDDLDHSVFFDLAHTNEAGAQVVADAMYAQLRSTLSTLAARPTS